MTEIEKKKLEIKVKSDTKLMGFIIIASAWLAILFVIFNGIIFKNELPTYAMDASKFLMICGAILILGRKVIAEVIVKVADYLVKK